MFIPWLLSDSATSRFLVIVGSFSQKDQESEAFSSCGICLHKKTFGKLKLRSYTNITPIVFCREHWEEIWRQNDFFSWHKCRETKTSSRTRFSRMKKSFFFLYSSLFFLQVLMAFRSWDSFNTSLIASMISSSQKKNKLHTERS